VPARNSSSYIELLIIDEAERLKPAALETLRDRFDRRHLGLILIGMPGSDKRLARYPQLYSRIGFAHHYQPLTGDELGVPLRNVSPAANEGDSPGQRLTARTCRCVRRVDEPAQPYPP
jgi:type II secretory pathway predicted ATPase ExeA